MQILDVDRIEPLPVLHLRVRNGELGIVHVDEEEPAGARIDGLAIESKRQLLQRLARAQRQPHHLRVRVVAADDRRRLGGRLPAEPARLEQQHVDPFARELPERRRAEDAAPDDDHARAGHAREIDSIVL